MHFVWEIEAENGDIGILHADDRLPYQREFVERLQRIGGVENVKPSKYSVTIVKGRLFDWTPIQEETADVMRSMTDTEVVPMRVIGRGGSLRRDEPIGATVTG